MAQTFSLRRLRFGLEAGSFARFVDQLTGATPEVWKGNGVRMEVGIFYGTGGDEPEEGDEVDVTASGYESLTVEVKETAASLTNLMAKTVEIFDDTLTAETWNDFTKAHAEIEFTEEETNIAAGNYHLVISVITTAGDPITLGVSTLTVKEDGAHLTVAAAPVNPGDAMTLAQADARYVLFSGTTLGGNGGADSGKVPLYGGSGELTAHSFHAVLPASGNAINAASFDLGDGIAVTFVYGVASTDQGLQIRWDGMLIFPSSLISYSAPPGATFAADAWLMVKVAGSDFWLPLVAA